MKRFGKLAVFAGLVMVGLGVLQVRHGQAEDHHHDGAVARAAHVANGVLDRVIDLIDWAWDRWGGSDQAEESLTAMHSLDGEFAWAGRLSAGDAIEIKGVNGDVVADLSEGRDVEVRAEKRSRRSDPDEVRIEVVEHSGGVTICAVYPGRGNTCEPGEGGRNQVQDNDVQVTFHVRVPEGVTFVGKTVNGDVRASELESDLTASTVNGDVDVVTTGSAEGSTVNGSIRAAMDSRDWNGTLEFTTVNGSIAVDLPDDVDADLEASWVNGGLESDLPFTASGRMSRRHAEGMLGQGGPDIELTTVNGSIRIR